MVASQQDLPVAGLTALALLVVTTAVEAKPRHLSEGRGKSTAPGQPPVLNAPSGFIAYTSITRSGSRKAQRQDSVESTT